MKHELNIYFITAFYEPFKFCTIKTKIQQTKKSILHNLTQMPVIKCNRSQL